MHFEAWAGRSAIAAIPIVAATLSALSSSCLSASTFAAGINGSAVYRKRVNGFWLAAILLHSATPTQVRAYPIEYSWTGHISPLYSQNDPWGLGPSGAPFELSFTLASDAPGYACDSLFSSACFPMTSSRLVIDGESVPMTRAGTVKFLERYDLGPNENTTPGSVPPRDVIMFTALFQDIGRQTQIVSTSALAPGAFHITDFNGPPITSGSLQTVGDSVGAIDIYQMVVPGGVTVSILPEPGVLGLLIVATLCHIVLRRGKVRLLEGKHRAVAMAKLPEV